MPSWCACSTAKAIGLAGEQAWYGLGFAPAPGSYTAMSFGRLVRVGSGRSDASAVIYVVAEADAAQAVRIVKTKLAQFDGEIEDLGRVSGDLLKALGLGPGAKDVFVHATALERAGIQSLHEGQKVKFDTQNDPRSGKVAVGTIELA